MTSIRAFAVIIISWVFFGQAYGQPQLQWDLKKDRSLLTKARQLLGETNLPSELTMLYYKVDLDVGDEFVKSHVQKIWYFPTPESVEGQGTEVIPFNQHRESVRVLAAASVDIQGVAQSFDPQTIQVVDSDRYNSFSDTKEAVIAIPGLKRGSASVLEYEVILDRSKLEMDWFDIYYPQITYPAEHFELNMAWNTTRSPMQWRLSSSHIQCSESEKQLSCVGKKIPAAKNDEGIIWRDVLGQLTLGGLDQWNDVIAKSRDAFKQAASDKSGLNELMNELLEGAQTQHEKIRRIHAFVSRDIRYISFSKHGNTITPHTISSVISNRYGDCKDKSALLVEMLKWAEVDAYPVLVSTQRESEERLSLPSMGYFNHMIACFDYQGRNYCLDATNTDTDWRVTPAWIQGKVSLPLIDHSAPKGLKRNGYRWQFDVDTHVEFTDAGGITEKQSRTYLGEYAGHMRSIFSGKTVEKRDETATQHYQDVVAESAHPTFGFSGVDDLNPRFQIYSETDFEPFFSTEADLSYYEYDSWLYDELDAVELDTRHYDTHFSGVKLSSRYTFEIGNRWVINDAGAELDLKHKFGRMKRKVIRSGAERLIYKTEIIIPEQEVAQADIEDFNRFLAILQRESTIYFAGRLSR